MRQDSAKFTTSSVTESSVIEVRQDSAKFKGQIPSHHTRWRLQIGADTDEVNGSNDTIYLLTGIGLSPGGSTHLHANNTYNNTNNN